MWTHYKLSLYCNINRHNATSAIISIYCTSHIMYFVSCCFSNQRIAMWNLNITMNQGSYILVYQIPGCNEIICHSGRSHVSNCQGIMKQIHVTISALFLHWFSKYSATSITKCNKDFLEREIYYNEKMKRIFGHITERVICKCSTAGNCAIHWIL